MNIKEEAVRYLEHRSRTCGEMKAHLAQKGFEEKKIRQTIEELKELHYLDDFQYTIAYLNYGFSKGKGIKLIKYELYDKEVDSNTIEDAMCSYEEEYGVGLDDFEIERAMQQAERVTDGVRPDEKMTAKIARRLSSKGYSSDVIYKVIGQIKKQEI